MKAAAILFGLAVLACSAAAGIDSVTQIPVPNADPITYDVSSGIVLTGIITKTGVTTGTGQGSNIGCQALVGAVSSYGGSWTSTTYYTLSYSTDSNDLAADYYTAHIYPSAGKYEVATHCWDTTGSDVWATSYGGNGKFAVTTSSNSATCGNSAKETGEDCDVGGAAVYGCTTSCKCESGHVASPTFAYWGCKPNKTMPSAQSSIWRSRAIYQILTDRFAHGDSSTPSCDVSSNTYCGGTFKGISNKLDYITGMGFDAIWISPVVENTDNGWHGYWAKNFTNINTNFGTLLDLKALVTACHNRGVLVMLDWVSNHVGPVSDLSSISTFSSSSYYHSCSSCPSGCSISDYTDKWQTENCRLSGLPDLDTSNSYVVSTLSAAANYILSQTGIDAMRIDTVPHVNLLYWETFRSSVNSFMIGEVMDSNPARGAAFQNPLDSVLWYPMYYSIRNVFASKSAMTELETTLSNSRSSFSDTTVLGRFVDNHDNPRFLYSQSDTVLYRNALAFTILGEGIPIVYYGSEQAYSGGADPYNREALWSSGFSTSTTLYSFIANCVKARKNSTAYAYSQITLKSATSVYAFSRTRLLVFLRNEGSSASSLSVTVTVPSSMASGTYYNALSSSSTLYITAGSSVTVTMPSGGMPLIYYLPKLS